MPLFTTYFSQTQIIVLVIASLTFLSSIFFQIKGKENYAIVFLLLTAFFVFCFAALLDPFLNLWDERFHALVAKNLMHHPLMPTLYDDPVVNMAYDRWDRYYIWLHKQPLFLWQIALSFTLFGISEFTLRLPDVFLGVIFVYIGYRSGRLLGNKRVGYITGVLIISTLYILELIGGRQELEHNDFSFMVYISLSIWAFIEYYYSGKKIWIYLIGLFSGMAILCKWLVGLLIYSGWAILKLLQKKYKLSDNKDLFTALPVTILIALPWQILILLWYPAEAALAYKYNSIHFLTSIEGHSGTFFYHFEMFNTIYGTLASILIAPSFYFMYRNCKEKQLILVLLSMVLVVFLFFSFAATKMPSFTIVISMIIFIAFASLFDQILSYIEKLAVRTKVINFIFLISICSIILLRFDIGNLQERHTTWKKDNTWTRMLSHNKKVFETLKLPANTVLFNVRGRHYIEAMFYTGFPAYSFIPSKEQYDDIKQKGRTIALFRLVNNELPEYLKNDTSLIIINEEIQGEE
jgi:4-amino-4-deoxy-L-arabinose transferase